MAFPTKSSARRTDGAYGAFSLPEILVALTIFSLLSAGIFATFLSFSEGLHISMDHADRSHKTQFAFEYIHKKLHSISEPHAASSTSFEFTTKDLNGDAERMKIYYDSRNKELVRSDSSGGRILLSGVDSLKFTYYDRFGTETSTLIDINAAKLEVQTEVAVTSGTKDVKTETSIITFRNRKL